MNAPLYGRNDREGDKGWNVVSEDEKNRIK
jgi:hypothetical protein